MSHDPLPPFPTVAWPDERSTPSRCGQEYGTTAPVSSQSRVPISQEGQPTSISHPSNSEEAKFLMGVAEIELPFPRATNIHGTEFLPHAGQAKNTGALVTLITTHS